jgi:hypothetical protein
MHNNKLKMIIIKWFQGMMEIMTFLPVLLIAAAYILSMTDIWIWLGFMSVYYLAGLGLGNIFKNRRIIVSVIFAIAISGIISWLCFAGQIGALIFAFVTGYIAVDRGIRLAYYRWQDIFPTAALWIGMVAYLIGTFLFQRIEGLVEYSTFINWAGLVYLILSLFIINLEQLKGATLPGDSEPVLSITMLRHNRGLIGVSIAIIISIAFFQQLKEGTIWFFKWIARLIIEFILFIGSLFQNEHPGESQGPENNIFDMLPKAEPREPSWFDKFIEVVGVILLIPLRVQQLSLFLLLQR